MSSLFTRGKFHLYYNYYRQFKKKAFYVWCPKGNCLLVYLWKKDTFAFFLFRFSWLCVHGCHTKTAVKWWFIVFFFPSIPIHCTKTLRQMCVKFLSFSHFGRNPVPVNQGQGGLLCSFSFLWLVVCNCVQRQLILHPLVSVALKVLLL